MNQGIAKQLQAGIFLLIGIILFIGSLFVIGREKQLFARQLPFYSYFPDIKGLTEGAPVRLAGVLVGRVEKIKFSRSRGVSELEIKLGVAEEYVDQIVEGSTVQIETQGLLGDRFLDITPSKSTTPLKPGDTIPLGEGFDIAKIGGSASDILERAYTIAERLDRVVGRFEESNGIAHEILYSKESAGDLRTILASVATITKAIEKGDGLAHSLIYSKQGEAIINALADSSAQIQLTVTELTRFVQKVINTPSLANSLLIRPTEVSPVELITKLAKLIDEIHSIATTLKTGQGTLGALLIDDSLYNNALEISDGAKKSVILKQAIKASLFDK
jgi:phospholipid/cholesterol/gamma-HCH transport system substrate-binding protein